MEIVVGNEATKNVSTLKQFYQNGEKTHVLILPKNIVESVPTLKHISKQQDLINIVRLDQDESRKHVQLDQQKIRIINQFLKHSFLFPNRDI